MSETLFATKRVVVESPLAGDFKRNKAYARACMHDSLDRGEHPYASHLLFDQPGILDDTIPEERERGIAAGFAWAEVADKRVFYLDLCFSAGMLRALVWAQRHEQPFEFRTLHPRTFVDAIGGGCPECCFTGYVPRVVDAEGPHSFVRCGCLL